MSKQEEIIEVCGKKVVVMYTKDGHPCEKCVLDGTKGCNSTKCSLLDRVGIENDERAYFADPWIRCSDCALFLGGKCTRPGGECARKAPLSEEIHSLREWAQILATNPELRTEFDKMCPPRPIQGSIAPEADLEAAENSEIIFSTDGELTIYSFVGAPRWWATIREAEEALSVFKAGAEWQAVKDGECHEESFEEGAKWQRERLMKDAVEGMVVYVNGFATLENVVLHPADFKNCERVSVIIIKKEK